MLTADQYGNALDYVTNSTNPQTSFMVGQDSGSGNIGKSRVIYYSVIRDSATNPPSAATPAERLGGSGAFGAAIVGWHGPRPVAFPLSDGWNFDIPIIT
jgi:hypothetical protein